MDIEKEIRQLKKQLKTLSTDIKELPPGEKLYLKQQGKYHYLVSRKKNLPGKYQDSHISIKNPKAQEYTNTAYAQYTIPLLQAEIKALEDFKQSYHPERKFEILCKVPAKMRFMLKHPIKSPQDEAEEWINISFYSNPYPIEAAEYIGRNGEHFRSKAEYIIGNILNEYQIPFRYECEYIINSKSFFPDFTIMDPNSGDLFYIEYFGLMDDPDYAQNALKKIALYQSGPDAGKFIFFFESASNPMNIDGIRNTIIKTLGCDR